MSVYSINLRSKLLAGPTELSVIVPNPPRDLNPQAFYSSGKKYKVLWLLHSGSGDQNDWLRNTNISYYAEQRQFIAVIPNGLNSDFADHPQFADGYNFSSFFFEELMPFIYNWFPASDKPENNFLSGFSMGGAATWMFGLMHPERFSGIAPLSSPPRDYSFLEPYRGLTASEFRILTSENRTALPSGYGNPKGGILTKEINMIAKYPTVGDFLDSCECSWERFREVAAERKLPQIYVVCGTEEKGFMKILNFQKFAEGLGVSDIVYEFIPGEGHNFEFWNSVIPKVLDFFKL